jgi:predicted metalloendopeptidase
MRILEGFSLALMFTGLLAAQQTPAHGIDRSYLDPTCKPCDDFWRYADGGWLDKNPIPARYSSWGTLPVLAQQNRERLRGILEAAAADAAAQPGSNERKIGDLYASCLDTASIDALGFQPLKPALDRVAAIQSPRDLKAALIEFDRVQRPGPIGLYATQDYKSSRDTIAAIGAGGLSLPDRDYYLKDDDRSKHIREEFLKHVAKTLELAGDSSESAAASAATILSFETALAQATLSRIASRDPYAVYHRTNLEGLSKLAPNFDWKALLARFDLPESTPINATEPEFLKAFSHLIDTAPLAEWRTWLRWRLFDRAAADLSQPFRDEDFHFRQTVLNGVTEQQPRWETCSTVVDREMGDALGEVFVEKYFPPESKRRMLDLVANLRAALAEELDRADWLSQETRKNAAVKLEAFYPKIGYPDRWRDYSGVTITRRSYFANVIATTLANRLYRLSKIGKPLDRKEWEMTPPTVNAYYNPTLNEIVFPAGILQPPLFDASADDAVNYGAIGAGIGHEMGHGFDDQGSKFDAGGNLTPWWTAEDRKKFEERAACVADQFDSIDAGGGLHHKGKLVVGEAMGDLGGLTLAYRAYHRSLGGKEAPVIDGFTGDQRFFLAFARTWAAQVRPEAARLLLENNPHPLPKFRCNATLQNMPEFQKAFGCQKGDPMVRPADQRCKLW